MSELSRTDQTTADDDLAGVSAAEVAELGPLIELAREIRRDIERVASDDAAGVDAIVETIDRLPREARARLAMAVFDRLSAEAQWTVLERLFTDDELRAYLHDERDRRVAALDRQGTIGRVADAARAAHRLDTRDVPLDARLVIGLFREADVTAAVRRGRRSSTCARRLVLRCVGPGAFRVVEDVFNPEGGYFVTADYDERGWRAERLDPHALVRVGSVSEGGDGPDFEPVLYPGGRTDVEVKDGVRKGQLHLGFVMLADRDVFAD